VESLPDTAEICGCNGVSKGAILAAIGKLKLTTVDQVRSRTKASASCGSCTCQVEALLAHAVGSGYDATPKVKAVCKCTTAGHDAVRKAIIEQGLKTIPAVKITATAANPGEPIRMLLLDCPMGNSGSQ